MGPKRQREVILGVLLVVLAGIVVDRWRSQPAGASVPSSNNASTAGRGPVAPQMARSPLTAVKLEELDAPRTKPLDADRNPFRFQPKAPPPPPGRDGPAPGEPVTPGESLSPPPPPSIALKFIGIVDAPGEVGKLAVLSDGRDVFHGRQGDIIEGRYRIVRIGTESVELAYLDGRGRQTIRLSGS